VQSHRRGIIAAGTFTVDRVKIVDEWPEEEHLAVITSTDKNGGGSAHNLGVDMRHLNPEIPVAAIGLLGIDDDASYLRNKLNSEGIDTTQLHSTDQAGTAFTDVISDSTTGKRTFFHHRGANDALRPEHFDFSLCDERILHLGLLGVHALMDSACVYRGRNYSNGWVAVLESARTFGIKTNLELVSIAADAIQRIATPCIEYLDSLIINEYELSALSGSPTVDGDGIPRAELCADAACSVVNESGLPLLVVHYPKAAVAVSADGNVAYLDAFTVDPSEIQSSVGAGDAFAAGMLHGLHERWELQKSLELGHAAAAASLRSSNTVGSVESVEKCLAFARGAH